MRLGASLGQIQRELWMTMLHAASVQASMLPACQCCLREACLPQLLCYRQHRWCHTRLACRWLLRQTGRVRAGGLLPVHGPCLRMRRLALRVAHGAGYWGRQQDQTPPAARQLQAAGHQLPSSTLPYPVGGAYIMSSASCPTACCMPAQSWS